MSHGKMVRAGLARDAKTDVAWGAVRSAGWRPSPHGSVPLYGTATTHPDRYPVTWYPQAGWYRDKRVWRFRVTWFQQSQHRAQCPHWTGTVPPVHLRGCEHIGMPSSRQPVSVRVLTAGEHEHVGATRVLKHPGEHFGTVLVGAEHVPHEPALAGRLQQHVQFGHVHYRVHARPATPPGPDVRPADGARPAPRRSPTRSLDPPRADPG